MKSIGAYLLDRLYDYGVRQIYGIPGDFVLAFFRCVERHGKIKIVTLSHEPALGFAADATARITGKLGVCAVTYGAGGHNIVNPIACAFAEKSPVVVISGAPGVEERKTGILFHHQAKTIDSQRKIFTEVTQKQAVLDDPATAAQKIHEALSAARLLARPVYIEIPRDRVFEPIRIPSHFRPTAPVSDKAAASEAAREIGGLLSKSLRPVLMIGIEIHRFSLRSKAVRLAEKMGVPVVSSFMARNTFPVHHRQFAGIYIGPAGPKKVQQMVEKSDCLILLGVPLADTDMAMRLKRLKPDRVVTCVSREVSIGHHQYENIALSDLIQALLKMKFRRLNPKKPARRLKAASKPLSYFGDQALEVEDIIHTCNFFLKKKGAMVTTVDNGDCLFASTLLDTQDLLASGYYATMGFAIPAGIGVQAATGKRPLILVGDGAFQMTGPEISHCPRLGLNPIVVVFNNRSWEMLRVLQPVGNYYSLTPWPFAKLAEDWGGRGYTVQTRRQMLQALFEAHAQKSFTLIDARTPLGHTSKVLQNYLAKIKG